MNRRTNESVSNGSDGWAKDEGRENRKRIMFLCYRIGFPAAWAIDGRKCCQLKRSLVCSVLSVCFVRSSHSRSPLFCREIHSCVCDVFSQLKWFLFMLPFVMLHVVLEPKPLLSTHSFSSEQQRERSTSRNCRVLTAGLDGGSCS